MRIFCVMMRLVREVGWWALTLAFLPVAVAALVLWPDTTDRDPYRDAEGL